MYLENLAQQQRFKNMLDITYILVYCKVMYINSCVT